MTVSPLKLEANRTNALHSTGPITANGKAVVSGNAMRHGLLSQRLLVDGEDPAEYQALLDDLVLTLRPQGAVEHALVERMAITLWRQRRLVSAETASINLVRRNSRIAPATNSELCERRGGEVTEEDLAPFDAAQIDWCRSVIEEFEKLGEIDLERLPTTAPLIYAQLVADATEDKETIAAHLAGLKNGLTTYAVDLMLWCRRELGRADRQPEVLSLTETLRTKRLVLPSDALDVFSRYQTTLDNQLFKSLRALRDAQEWRLKTLEHTGSQPTSGHQEFDEVA